MPAGGPTTWRWRMVSASTPAGASSRFGQLAPAASLREDFRLSPGDRVAIVMRNRPEYLEALLAIWHAGLVAVPVNARLHRDENAYILEHSESAVVVTDGDPWWERHNYGKVVKRELRDRLRAETEGGRPTC